MNRYPRTWPCIQSTGYRPAYSDGMGHCAVLFSLALYIPEKRKEVKGKSLLLYRILVTLSETAHFNF